MAFEYREDILKKMKGRLYYLWMGIGPLVGMFTTNGDCLSDVVVTAAVGKSEKLMEG